MLRRFDNGTAQPNLSSANLRLYKIPLPPLAEQHRIVAKVDELMALCDRLEAARGSREAVRDHLTAASLARLNAADPENFQADARFETYTSKYNDFGLSQSFKWPKGTLCITIAANIADSGILNFDACFPDWRRECDWDPAVS